MGRILNVHKAGTLRLQPCSTVRCLDKRGASAIRGRETAVCLQLVALVAVFVTGCGETEDDRARDAVRETVQRYEDALSNNRHSEACALTSAAGQRRLVVNVRGDPAQNRGRRIVTCEDAIAAISGGERSVATEVEFLPPDRARVRIEVPTSDDPAAGGDVETVLENGRWRIGTTF
jgi:hypothetical protein